MVRIPPERGAASRMELRLGDATANPYLAIAGRSARRYLGIRDKLEPPPPLEGYGYDPTRPRHAAADLATPLDALEADTELGRGARRVLRQVVPAAYKRNEVERFDRFVTDWEFREYAYHL